MLAFERYHSADLPPLICLHGFMGRGADWAEVAQRLPHRHIIAPDLWGHGRSLSADVDRFRLERVAEDVITLLDSLFITQADLLGYSMGGRLAFYLAIQWPSRWSSLVNESATLGLESAEERAVRRQADEQIAQTLESVAYPDFLQRWYDQPLFATLRHHPSFPALFARKLTNQPHQLAIALRQMGTGAQPSLWSHWSACPVPTLLLVGERDSKFTQIGRKIAQLNARTRLHILPQLGHNLHEEAPARFVLALPFGDNSGP